MRQVNIHEAKTHLSRLLQDVSNGEDVIIANAGKPIARLTRVDTPASGRQLGRDAGLFLVPDDFDAPLPEAVMDSFEA